MSYKTNAIKSLRLKYEAEILKAKTNIDVYLGSPVGIGEHPDLVGAIDSELDKLTEADDRLGTLQKYFDEN